VNFRPIRTWLLYAAGAGWGQGSRRKMDGSTSVRGGVEQCGEHPNDLNF